MNIFSTFLLTFSKAWLLSLILIGYSKAEIYQWKDENGHTHFGDSPPLSSEAKEVSNQLNQINISSDLSSPEMMLHHQQAKDAEREKQYQVLKKQSESQASNALQCKNLKNRLKKIKGRVVFLDDQAKDVKVSESERKHRVILLETEIRKHCQ